MVSAAHNRLAAFAAHHKMPDFAALHHLYALLAAPTGDVEQRFVADVLFFFFFLDAFLSFSTFGVTESMCRVQEARHLSHEIHSYVVPCVVSKDPIELQQVANSLLGDPHDEKTWETRLQAAAIDNREIPTMLQLRQTLVRSHERSSFEQRDVDGRVSCVLILRLPLFFLMT